MSPRLVHCDPEVDVLSALKVMAAAQVRRLPVVDATGTLRGVLSIGDVVRNAGQHHGGIPYQAVIETLQQIYAPPVTAKEICDEHAPAQAEDDHVALACMA